MKMRVALSNNHSSVDDQIADVVSWLSNDSAHADMMEREFSSSVGEFAEYNDLVWAGSWVDTEASGVDPEYMSWVADWIDSNTLVYWEDGEPWVGEDVNELDD